MPQNDPDRVKEEIRSALDILDVIGTYIPLRRNGPNAVALCPFHKEKTPSFHVNAARQTFHCFGCGVGGDVFSFIMKQEGVDFPTALRLLGQRAGIPVPDPFDRRRPTGTPADVPKDRIFAANTAANALYLQALNESPAAAHARAYLAQRRLPQETWAPFGIGYAPNNPAFLANRARQPNPPFSPETLDAAGLTIPKTSSTPRHDRFRDRLTFSIRDELGRIAGFSARTLNPNNDNIPKYINTNETRAFRKSRILYGLDRARKSIHDASTAILCEGQIDCIRCHLAGFSHVIASQGTAFTPEHARLLKRYASSAILVLDADAAGEKAALRTAELLLAEEIDASIATLPPGEDPDSLILKQGPEAFQHLLHHAIPVVDFLLRLLRQNPSFRTDAGIRRAADRILSLIAASPGAVQREQMIRSAARGLGLRPDSLQADLQKKLQKRSRFSHPHTPDPIAPVLRSPPIPHAPIPLEQTTLAELLCNAPQDHRPPLAALVRSFILYPMLHPQIRPILSALAEEEVDLLAALEDAPEPSKKLLAKISNTPSKIIAPPEDLDATLTEAVRDCIRRIWRRHLLAKRANAAHRRDNAPSPEARNQALREEQTIQLDLAKIRGPWINATAVFSAYLANPSNPHSQK